MAVGDTQKDCYIVIGVGGTWEGNSKTLFHINRGSTSPHLKLNIWSPLMKKGEKINIQDTLNTDDFHLYFYPTKN